MSSSSRARRWLDARTQGWSFLLMTLSLMIGFYAALYHPYPAASLPGRCLSAYLALAASGSATLLVWLGEPVVVLGATVLGRFPYVVVLDCAALDAQALYAAAVLAFPAAIAPKLLGLVGGLAAIWLINVSRLVGLYYAGVHSRQLFRVLHEEVMVLVVMLSVCGLFFAWAWWVRGHATRRLPPLNNLHAA